MNNLKKCDIAPIYSSGENVKEFYNQILSSAKSYKRVSAYFNKGIFKYISKGFNQFLKNDGYMQLVLSTEVDNETFSSIKEGYELRENISKHIILDRFFDFENQNNEDVNLLTYLIACKRIDVRIALRTRGIFHDKFGIVEDYDNNILIFSGSNNETEAAIEYNYESFEVTKNWDNPSNNDLVKIRYRLKEFEQFWNDEKENLIVLKFEDVIRDSVIRKLNPIKLTKDLVHEEFIVIKLDEENRMILKGNFKFKEVYEDYLFQRIKIFGYNFKDYSLIIKEIKYEADLEKFRETLRELSLKFNFKLILSDELLLYLDKRLLNLNVLAKKGTYIKDNINSLESDLEFKDFVSKVDALLNRSLRFAQSKAAYHIVKLKRTMNFSVPGSGKTASILGAFEYLSSKNNNDNFQIKRLLVFGPINCFKAWRDEYRIVSKNATKDDLTEVIDIKSFDDALSKKMVLKYDYDKAKIVLINFESIVSLQKELEKLVDQHTMVVFDEIHRIKKIDSDKYNACKVIINKTSYRVALTGTPLPNGYEDLSNTFNLLYGTYSTTYFGMNLDRLKNSDRLFNQQGLEDDDLNKLIYPFYIRTSKDDLGVPKPNPDNLHLINASNLENDLYFKTLNNSKNHFETAIKLMELGCIPHKVSNDSSLENFQTLFRSKNSDITQLKYYKTSKLSKLIELLHKYKAKSLVWCVFVDTINLVNELLLNEGFKPAVIYGRTNEEERNYIIDSFNSSDEFDVLITNPHTLAESVSLHKSCHTAYYLELDYNLSHFLQSKDRIHRLGLENDVETNYHIMINVYGDNIDKSIDHRIYNRLQKKEKRMKNAIDKGRFFYLDDDSSNELEEILEEILD